MGILEKPLVAVKIRVCHYMFGSFESRFADTIGKICCATCYHWRPEDRQIMVGTMQITRSHEFGGLCHSYWTKLSSPFLMLLQCAFQKL